MTTVIINETTTDYSFSELVTPKLGNRVRKLSKLSEGNIVQANKVPKVTISINGTTVITNEARRAPSILVLPPVVLMLFILLLLRRLQFLFVVPVPSVCDRSYN